MLMADTENGKPHFDGLVLHRLQDGDRRWSCKPFETSCRHVPVGSVCGKINIMIVHTPCAENRVETPRIGQLLSNLKEKLMSRQRDPAAQILISHPLTLNSVVLEGPG